MRNFFVILAFFNTFSIGIYGQLACTPESISPVLSIVSLYIDFFVIISHNFFRKKTSIKDPSELPELPGEFQTRIQIGDYKEQMIEALMLYDSFDRKAELVVYEGDTRTRVILYYDLNELFLIKGKFLQNSI